MSLMVIWIRDVREKGNQRRFFGLGLSIRADGVLSTKIHESMDLGVREEEIKSSALSTLDWICLEDHQMETASRRLLNCLDFKEIRVEM